MNALDLSNVTYLLEMDFTTFKALHLNNQNPAKTYYLALESAANAVGLIHVENYAKLAKNVVINFGVNGGLVNLYTETLANDLEIDFSIGSDNRLKLQYELMQADLTLRLQKTLSNGTGELDYQETMDIHSAALDSIELPPTAFPLFTPLSQIGSVNPEEAQFLFQTALDGDGFIDVLQDGILLGFGVKVGFDQPLSERLEAYADQAAWLALMLRAATEYVDTYGPEENERLTDLLELLEVIANFAGYGFNNFSRWAENLPENNNPRLPQNWVSDEVEAKLNTAKAESSPLVLDLGGNGIDLTALDGTGSVYWDIDSDGMAEASGWVAPTDGLLVLDWNNDGVINDHTELFGTETLDGFVVLAGLDSDANNVINASDGDFARLLVWKDLNSDGYSQSGELYTLSQLGITSISLNATAVNYDINGNTVTSESTFVMNGQKNRDTIHFLN